MKRDERTRARAALAKRVRVSLGMSQAEFARFLAISARTICRWESGVSLPTGLSLVVLRALEGGHVALGDDLAVIIRRAVLAPPPSRQPPRRRRRAPKWWIPDTDAPVRPREPPRGESRFRRGSGSLFVMPGPR